MTSHVIYILSIYVKRSGGSGRIDRNSVCSPAARHHTKSTMKDARSHFLWLPFSLDSFLSGFFPPWLPSSLSHLTSLLPPSLHSSLPPSLSALLNVAYTLLLFCSQQANLLSFASNLSKANLPPSPAPSGHTTSRVFAAAFQLRFSAIGAQTMDIPLTIATETEIVAGAMRQQLQLTLRLTVTVTVPAGEMEEEEGAVGVGQGARLACCKVEANKTRRICCALLSWRLGGACLL